jgi:hypothetical protein
VKLVPLVGRKYGGMFALVDDEDFERINAYRWYAHFVKGSRTCYARTFINKVTMKLSDGSKKIYYYDRKTGKRLGMPEVAMIIENRTA